MHGVAAEIAKEVIVLFQNGDSNAGTRQKISQHHARGATAHYAARRL